MSGKKRPRTLKVAQGVETDEAYRKKWNADLPLQGTFKEVAVRGATICTWEMLSLPPSATDLPPKDGASAEEWDKSGWGQLEVGMGKTSSVCHPVSSVKLTQEEFYALAPEEQFRCVPGTEAGEYFYCARNKVDGVGAGGKERQLYYLANCIRWATETEAPNCRLMLNWDHKEDDATSDRCMVISLCKTQRGMEWKLDLNYAKRMLGLLEDDDESVAEVIPEPGATGRLPPAKKLSTREEHDQHMEEFRNRMVSGFESCGMQLSEIQKGIGRSDDGLAGELSLVSLTINAVLTELRKQREEQRLGMAEQEALLKEQVGLLKQLVAQGDADSRGAQDAMSVYSPSGRSEDSPLVAGAGPKVAKAAEVGAVVSRQPIPYNLMPVDLTPKPVSSMTVAKKGTVAGKKV